MQSKELARLRWHCRRGMLELDLMLLPFVDGYYGQLSKEQQQAFINLLSESDQDLWQWLSGTATPTVREYEALIKLISDYAKTEH